MGMRANREQKGHRRMDPSLAGERAPGQRHGAGRADSAPGPAPGNRSRTAFARFCLALLAACLVQGAAAQTDAEVEVTDAQGTAGSAAASSTLGPVLQGSTGLVTLNQTAGDGNVQQNSAALAESEGHSVAAVNAVQVLERVVPTADQWLTADIESGAFDDAQGIYLVNQSAGAGNSQFNGAALAVGGVSALAIVQLDDTRLQEQSAGSAAPLLPAEGGAQVSAGANLAPDAFAGARGLFLVNQAAGNNNATANTFTFSSPP